MERIEIIYEDKNFLALNKPAGLLVHRMPYMKARAEEPTLADWLLKERPETTRVGDDPAHRPGIVHRLDRETSGVMVIAKTQEAFEYLKSLFKKREVQKMYLALVRGRFKTETGMPEWRIIDAPIGIKTGSVKRTTRGGRMMKPAMTEYRVVKEASDGRGEPLTFLEVMPKTGRTHQIRVHLASIGHPIVGDAFYSGKATVKKSKATCPDGAPLMLHAYSLEFTAPDGARMKIEAPAPPAFQLSTMQDSWRRPI